MSAVPNTTRPIRLAINCDVQAMCQLVPTACAPTANAIAPAARTGMTTAVESMAQRMAKPEDGSFDYWAPENVSSLLVWLASAEAASVSGKVFEAEGGKISIADGWRKGPEVDKGDRWAPAEVGQAVEKLLAEAVPAQKVYGS